MNTLRALAATALALALVDPAYATTITFDDEFDLRFTDLVRDGVTYSVDPADSGVYGAGNYQLFDGFELISATALELDGGTLLTIDFSSALESVQLDVGHADFGEIADLASVKVYGADGAELIWNDVLAPPFSGNAYERHYGYFDGGVRRVTVEYGDVFSFSPLAVDNLVLGASSGGPPPPVIPEPATYAYLLAGLVALLWIGGHRQRISG
jgi:hypothetical protein